MIPSLLQAPRPLHLSTIASNDTKPRMTRGAGITSGPLQTWHNWDALHVLPGRYPGDGVLQIGVTVRRRDPTQRGHKSKTKSCLSVKTRLGHKKWPEEVHQSQCPGHQPSPRGHPSFHVQPQDGKEIMTRMTRVHILIPGTNTEIIVIKRCLHQRSPDRRRQTEIRRAVHRLGLLSSPGPAPKPSRATPLPSPEPGALRTGCAGSG